jgi:hypothetical protein
MEQQRYASHVRNYSFWFETLLETADLRKAVRHDVYM